jgi:hypothetical protein
MDSPLEGLLWLLRMALWRLRSWSRRRTCYVAASPLSINYQGN